MTIDQINSKKPKDSLLVALYLTGSRTSKKGMKIPLVMVKCSCGNEKIIDAYDISLGKTKSCGCTRKINSGHTSKFSNSTRRLYNIWRQMLYRCYNKENKSYKYYGAKGVFVCDEWRCDYQKFLDWSLSHGYAVNLTIDRRDNDNGYCPENCRWVTLKENCNNRSSCVYISNDGVTKSVQEWCRFLNMNRGILEYRIFKQGFSISSIIASKNG